MRAIYGSSYYTIVDGPSWTHREANASKLGVRLRSLSWGIDIREVSSNTPQMGEVIPSWIGDSRSMDKSCTHLVAL